MMTRNAVRWVFLFAIALGFEACFDVEEPDDLSGDAGDSDTDADADIDTDTGTGEDTDTGADTETGVDTDTDTDTGSEIDNCSDWDSAWAALEAEAIAIVNEYRESGYDCPEGYSPPAPPLVMDVRLRCAARLHSLDMATHDFIGETGSDGYNFAERAWNQGYEIEAMTENLAAGSDTAAGAVAYWMSSPDGWNCGNIMDPIFEDVGIGVAYDASSTYGWYWTQVLGHELPMKR